MVSDHRMNEVLKIRMSPELKAALDRRAKSDGRPASEIVRDCISRYVGSALGKAA